jgi:Phytanoyl-CoA dioxygenase (PhyH)
MTNRLPTLTPSRVAAVSYCAALLREYGVVVVDGWVADKKLKRLLAEHHRVFAEEIPNGRYLDYYRPGIGSRAVHVVTEQIRDVLPETHEFLIDAVIREVVAVYLGEAASVNHAAYLTLDVAHATPVTALHYDRKPAVKTFLCLTAANAECGAPAFVPGSHKHGRAIRNAHLASGMSESDLPITSGHEGWIPLPMSSPAGSLVIFDTDCLHMGGQVMPGHTRRVLRGHSHVFNGQ